MRACVQESSYSISVNDSRTEPIRASRGLRQVDPLSPFLFTMVAEALNGLMNRAKQAELIQGLEISPSSESITHLQFADDTLLFCEASSEELFGERAVLRCFELVSGLRINIGKSNIIGLGIETEELDRLARELGCGIEKIPFTYLGLPVGANPRSKVFWEPILERISKKLNAWSKSYLSIGGRLTLIKLCLVNLPTYYLSLFEIQKGVAKRLEKIQRDFL